MQPLIRLLVLGGLCILLTGCKIELYSGLSEREGNEMLAILLGHGIPATKVQGKGGLVDIMVDDADVAGAVDILNRRGFPRDEFSNLGDVFQQQGLISSPLEERARFGFGLGQSISETLTQIDGVLTARVHIVLPEGQTSLQQAEPASAAVFVKYRPGLGLEEAVPKIKLIVQNSVQALSYDKISVAMFPARIDDPAMEGPSLGSFFGVRVAQDSRAWLMTLVLGLLVLLVASLTGNGYLFWRMRGTARSQETPADE